MCLLFVKIFVCADKHLRLPLSCIVLIVQRKGFCPILSLFFGQVSKHIYQQVMKPLTDIEMSKSVVIAHGNTHGK